MNLEIYQRAKMQKEIVPAYIVLQGEKTVLAASGYVTAG
jgi:hypothetical protein